MEKTEVKKVVRENYARVAVGKNSCCSNVSSCCDTGNMADQTSKKIGYSEAEIKSTPEGANLGLGCGNPVALASLKEGEIVLDLGSGAGFDCFLSANKVGKGRVIGVDMTPEMLEKARANARKGNYTNVEFRLGEIENLPVPDNHVDVIISNCVINLSPEKEKVFNEAFRVLKPGGRLMISDIVLLKKLPEAVINSITAYIGCIAGAETKNKYLSMISKAGFEKVKIIAEDGFDIDFESNDPSVKSFINETGVSLDQIREMSPAVKSIKVQAFKP